MEFHAQIKTTYVRCAIVAPLNNVKTSSKQVLCRQICFGGRFRDLYCVVIAVRVVYTMTNLSDNLVGSDT